MAKGRESVKHSSSCLHRNLRRKALTMLKIARIFRWALALGATGLVTCSFAQTAGALENGPPQDPSSPHSPRKTSFIPFVLAGGAVRIDDAPLFNITQRLGGNFGVGFLYEIQPISFGLSYEYTGLGREDSGVGPFGFVRIDRSLDTVLASIKMDFSGPKWGTPYFGVGIGAAFQDASMKGIVLPDRGVSGGVPFSCTSSDTINLALRAGGGFKFPLSPNVSLITDATFDVYRLSSDVIQLCAPGAGTTSAFLFRLGLAYRFDMAEGNKPPRRLTPR
jgi:opacity protein-like surface antigen